MPKVMTKENWFSIGLLILSGVLSMVQAWFVTKFGEIKKKFEKHDDRINDADKHIAEHTFSINQLEKTMDRSTSKIEEIGKDVADIKLDIRTVVTKLGKDE